MNKVFLKPNPTRDNALEISYHLARFLFENGFQIVVEEQYKPLLCTDISSYVRFDSEQSAIDWCQFILVAGGDGTILHAAVAAATHNKPILGLNVGTIGFLSELEQAEFDSILNVKNNDYSIEMRMMLDIEVHDNSSNIIYSGSALNDAIIAKGSGSRMISIEISADDKDTIFFRGDGVIICTPTGSTAYSLSAGGAIMEPQASCLGVTPICPHALNVKSFVLSSERTVTVNAKSISGSINLTVDGKNVCEISENNKIIIKKSALTTPLLKLKDISFYQLINRKLTMER